MTRWLPSLTCFAAACAAQPWVGGDPVLHVLVQMPFLAFAGALVPIAPRAIPRDLALPLAIVALTTALYWMLPRAVDAALITWQGHAAKFITLPLLLGVPFGLAWPRLGPVLRGFAKAQTVSMLLLLGFLYTHAPIRICNSYLVDDQVRLGLGFACLAAALAVFWIIPAFTGASLFSQKGPAHELPRFGH